MPLHGRLQVMTIAIAVPNLNQGQFLAAALDSLGHSPAVRIAVLDAGSTDGSVELLRSRAGELSYWRSHRDDGQAAAINEGVRRLCELHPDVDAVGWLNADDTIMPGGLEALAAALEAHPDWSAVAGRAHCLSESGEVIEEIPTAPFSVERFSLACTISQPATLIRRTAWEAVGGLDASLDMCFDYDLWWKLSHVGAIGFIDRFAAASRDHGATKTRQRREQYFREAIALVRRETGAVPWHWCISEALERQAGWTLGRRPSVPRRLLAAAQAATAWLRRNYAAAPA